jgi:hypothetical protein
MPAFGQGVKKNTCGSGSRPTLFFSADPIIFSTPIDRATLFSPGGCGLLIQRAKMASVVTLIIERNCLNSSMDRKYASLVNIDVGTLLQIAQQKTAKTMKKIFLKKFISDLPTLIFSRYETGTTGIFFLRPRKICLCVRSPRKT